MVQLIPPLRILELRTNLKLTQEQLGLLMINHPDPLHADASVRRAAAEEVRSYETVELAPGWDRIVALAHVLGCDDVRDLFEPMPIKKWARILDQLELEAARAGSDSAAFPQAAHA